MYCIPLPVLTPTRFSILIMTMSSSRTECFGFWKQGENIPAQVSPIYLYPIGVDFEIVRCKTYGGVDLIFNRIDD